MQIEQRSYGGKLFRPKPIVHSEQDGRLFISATPWGSPVAAEKAVQMIVDYYMSAQQDRETTSPFEMITSINHQANTLRTAILLANESLYREENRQEYQTSCEIFVGSYLNGTFYWAQIGQPHLILCRQGHLYPLSLSFDFTIDYGLFLAPLPRHLLGIHSHISPYVNSAKIYQEDELILVSRAKYLSLFSTSVNQRPLEELSKEFSKEDPNAPFWISKISF
ncbi:MAG: hypothetical protein KDD50_08985 [Bdellovibrionales bacterium]|nr:hypothetical protein [Bdellovibrionales bacterium]